MDKIFNRKLTMILLIIISILFLGFFLFVTIKPVTFNNPYKGTAIKNGEEVNYEIKFLDQWQLSISENDAEPQIVHYLQKGNEVIPLFEIKNDADFFNAITLYSNNWEFISEYAYVVDISAFGLKIDKLNLSCTCSSTIIFAIAGGLCEIALIALSIYSIIQNTLNKSSEHTENENVEQQ